MDELYVYLRQKLDEARKNKTDHVEIDFDKLAKMYQILCFMKQIRNIVDWC